MKLKNKPEIIKTTFQRFHFSAFLSKTLHKKVYEDWKSVIEMT